MRHMRYSFKVSGAAMCRLRQLKNETSETLRNEFRRLAWMLSRDHKPRFEAIGANLVYDFLAPMSPEEYAGLVVVAARYGVPKSAIGEMVLSYIPREPS